jgi:hypothetical protein
MAVVGAKWKSDAKKIDSNIELFNRTGKRMAKLVHTHPRISVVVAIAAGLVALFALPDSGSRTFTACSSTAQPRR